MKTNTTTFMKGLFSLSVLALAITSCKKDSDSTSNPATGKPAKISIINASPGSPELALLAGGKKTATAALTYASVLYYFDIAAGKQELSFTKKDDAAVLAKSTVELKSSTNYSLYVADVPGKNVLVLTADDLSIPATDKAKIRFINMSPDAGSIDFNVAGKTAIYTKQDFKTVTLYKDIDPAAEVTFEIRENGKTDLLASLPKMKIEKGKTYTVWAKGLKTGGDATTKLGLAMINR